MQSLKNLRGEIILAAQKIYDDWDGEEGGICDDISSAIMGILAEHDLECNEGGFDGDDHSYVVVPISETHGFNIDIPWSIYEKKIRYYEYKKIPNIKFAIEDVELSAY